MEKSYRVPSRWFALAALANRNPGCSSSIMMSTFSQDMTPTITIFPLLAIARWGRLRHRKLRWTMKFDRAVGADLSRKPPMMNFQTKIGHGVCRGEQACHPERNILPILFVKLHYRPW